jgi:molecular chaperone DnaK
MRLPLPSPGPHTFALALLDEAGARVPASVDTFSIHRGLTAAAPPLSRSIGVVVRDQTSAGRKQVEWLVPKHTPLPTTGTFNFRTTLALEPGGEIEVIGVYLVEGEARRPERNRQVGYVEITDRDVPRSLPAGSPVEIRIDVSASRLLSCRVFLPVTDQSFDVAVHMTSEEPKVSSLTQDLLTERDRLDAAAPHLEVEDIRALTARFSSAAEQIRSAAGSDPGARQQALMSLKELQERLDDIDAGADLPRAREEAREEYSETSRAVLQLGSESQQRRLEALAGELDAAIAGQDLEPIERAASKISRLRFEVLAQQPWFWRDWFEYLAGSVTDWRDPASAEAYIREGTNAIARGDIATLRRAALGLSSLAPSEQGSFEHVGLRRG